MAHETPELRRMSRSPEETDPAIAAVLRDEVRRQATGLELIPSENLFPRRRGADEALPERS
jgi:glycine/serine hydroxymethyltransferase